MNISRDYTLVDTHAHLYDRAFAKDRDRVVERSISLGVNKILLPAVNSKSHSGLFELCERYPNNCFPMMGLHPTSVNDNPHWRRELDLVENYLKNPPVERFYAVGEVGLDLHWSRDFIKEQIEAFKFQIELSLKHDLPLAIHSRTAWEPILEVLSQYKDRGMRGVMHSFSGEMEHYKMVKELGDFMFGISGVVTFNNTNYPELLSQIPLSDIILETDAPYLTPIPYRGRRNESSYVTYICDRVAEIYNLSPREVADTTTANAQRLFKF